MAEERPPNPPLSVPIRGFTTPVNQEGFFSERVDYTTPEYREIPRGTKYSTIVGADPNIVDQFTELYFLRETRDISSYPWGIRFWATDTLAEDTYNSAVEYVSEAVTFPAFTRSYTVRRDSYEASSTLEIGSPLTSIIGIKVSDGGQDYTEATVTITGTGSDATAEAVIDTDGTIASIIVTNCGTGYTETPTIEIIGDGGGAVAIGIIQPQSAVLVSQKKTEFPDEKLNTGGLAYAHPLKNEYVIVTRVYETLPGPWVYSQKEDTDGGLITVKTRRNISADITVEETLVGALWSDTTKKGVDDFVAEETVESRSIAIDNTTANAATRMTTSRVDEDGMTVTVIRLQASAAYLASINPREVVSGGVWGRITSEPISHLKVWFIGESRPIPGNVISTEKIDEDGVAIGVFKTMVTLAAFNAIVPRETVSGGFWTKYTCEPISDLIVWKVQESRAIPGNVIVEDTIDEDGMVLRKDRTLKAFSTITPSEQIIAGVWGKIESKAVSDLVAWEIVTARVVPGNPIAETKFAEDGNEIDTVRTFKDASTIITQETLIAGVWHRTTKKAVTDLVAWEIVEARDVPGVTIPSAKVGEDGETELIASTVKGSSSITPGQTESGGTLTTVEQKRISELISEEEVSTKDWLDAAQYSVSIPETVIPIEFRAGITTTVESHIVAGIASMPTLASGEFEHSQKQQTKRLYEERITKLGDVDLPITQTGNETSSQFGGAVLDVVRTLSDSLLTADEGEDVVASFVNPIGDNLMWFKETKKRPATDAEWPILTEYDQDPETLALITATYEVIDSSLAAAPSVVTGTITRYKKIDKWRSLKIVEVYSLPADYEEQRFMASHFPSLWDFTIYNYSTACGPTGYIREGFSTMVQARVAISFSTAKETITGLTLIPNTHHLVHDIVSAVLNDAGTLTYVGSCSGPVTLPASSPDYTTYIGSIQNTEQLITGESVLWRAGLYKNTRLYLTMI